MLLYLTEYLSQFESGFNVFSYLTMRAILGALTALILSFLIGPRMIARLSLNQVGQPVRGKRSVYAPAQGRYADHGGCPDSYRNHCQHNPVG